jgi:hypothetical protein
MFVRYGIRPVWARDKPGVALARGIAIPLRTPRKATAKGNCNLRPD